MFDKTPAPWIVAGLLAVPLPAGAQYPNLAEISGQYMPGAPVEDAPPAEVQVASYDAAVNFPIVLADETFLVIGAAHHADSVSFQDTPPDFVELRTFHSTEVSLLFVQLLPHDWSVSIRLAPGLAGDYNGFDLEMLRLNTVALASHAFSESFALGGGLLTSYAFGEILPLPALYLEWRIGSFRLETFLPSFLWAGFELWNRLELGVQAELQGNEYAVRDGRIRDSAPCRAQAADDPDTERDERVRDADACLDHFAYSVGSAGLTAGVRIFDDLWLTLYGGHTLFRRFEPKNAENETLRDGGNDLENQFLFRASLAWRISAD